MNLTLEQQTAITKIENHKNIFITSRGAGCGKTYLLNHIIQTYKHQKNIAITASTGVSATLINGQTLHSWAGIQLGRKEIYQYYNKIKNNKKKLNRWIKTDMLIIDEISLISPILFDKLEELARLLRENDKPFGGIQLIISGDWLQLQTINCDQYTFEANTWNKCITDVIYLTKIHRQSNPEFQEVLNSIRIGRITNKVKSLLRSRVGIKLENIHGIIPTRLYSLNINVDEINNHSLNSLVKLKGISTEMYKIKWTSRKACKNIQKTLDSFFIKHAPPPKKETNKKPSNNKTYNQYLSMCNAVENLELCTGAQVMLLVNLDHEQHLVNGARGVVESFNIKNLPIVKFLNGVREVIDFHTWNIEVDNNDVGEFKQIPLKLAWATTIHKSQGSTLDFVEIDLKNIFELSQGYVGLSRVKSLEGLAIKGLCLEKFRVNRKALKYYETLEEHLNITPTNI